MLNNRCAAAIVHAKLPVLLSVYRVGLIFYRMRRQRIPSNVSSFALSNDRATIDVFGEAQKVFVCLILFCADPFSKRTI